jgi:hypothetical protein
MYSDRMKKQRFWYLLERKLLGTGTSDELDELDEMAKANQKAYDSIALVDRLWQFRSADQMEQVIRQELADGHEKKYLWPEQRPKTAKIEQCLPAVDCFYGLAMPVVTTVTKSI